MIQSDKCHGCLQVEPHLNAMLTTVSGDVGSDRVQLLKMDIQNECHFLKDIEGTPKFIIYQRKGGNYWLVDLLMDEPLTAKDGFPDFEKLNESEQIRAIVTKRVSDFIKNLDRRF